MNVGDKIVMIPQDEYNDLLESARWLCALEAAGVDNWEGFDEACKILKEWDDEE